MQSKLSILAVTNLYPTEKHPTLGVFVEQQIKGLREIGVEVSVVFINRAEQGMNAYLRMMGPVRSVAQEVKPTLVHIMYGGVMADIVTRWNSRLPTVVTFHGSDLSGENQSGTLRRWISRFGVVCSRRAARRADGVIVVSARLRKSLPLDMEESKIRIIPCGIDLERFTPKDKTLCQRQLGWSANSFHVLFPSNNGDPVKRPWLAGQAVTTLNHAGLRAELHYMRNILNTEVPIWLNASDALLLTSAHEGSPTVVKEALACGVPVVSVDVGDVLERLDGIAGCYVSAPSPRALAQNLMLVQQDACRLGVREKLKYLSIHETAKRLANFYRELLVANVALLKKRSC